MSKITCYSKNEFSKHYIGIGIYDPEFENRDFNSGKRHYRYIIPDIVRPCCLDGGLMVVGITHGPISHQAIIQTTLILVAILFLPYVNGTDSSFPLWNKASKCLHIQLLISHSHVAFPNSIITRCGYRLTQTWPYLLDNFYPESADPVMGTEKRNIPWTAKD